MYPHERSLVKRMEGQPFVLLGVNSDPKERLRRAMKKEHITWRSWWDGGGTAGPIAGKWNVRGWSTVYLLDHKGVIRAKDPPEKELERIVDQLLKERIEEKIK